MLQSLEMYLPKPGGGVVALEAVASISRTIRAEADLLLARTGLMPILRGYGTPCLTGSYILDLMTWRDLDLYLAVEDLDRGAFFALGRSLSEALKPHKMTYRDELVGKTPGLPVGWYWGSYTRLIPGTEWKVDLWVLGHGQVSQLTSGVEALSARLTPGTRRTILHIKADVCTSPLYRQEVYSTDIYEAVLARGVSTVEQFWSWVSAGRPQEPGYSRQASPPR